ncbi:MAG: serine/threonine protein phosphatase, partial [Candidatus Korarchaeota archaeon]|nr:serine/threonine protein phosphatase [Candidatus Korarchaeota archaeon]
PVAMQLLWNDPDESIEDFAPSVRGPGVFRFGRRAFRDFMDNSRLRLLVRAHEFFPEGVRTFFGGRLLSVFSCRFYGGTPAALLMEEGLSWRIVPLS